MIRVTIHAIGRLRSGPERSLIDDFLTRADKIGRGLGVGPFDIRESEAKRSGKAEEAKLLRASIPDGAVRIALDERGKVMSSPEFADLLARHRDDGRRDIALIIGGADGIAPDLRAECDMSLSFGRMVWPHMLARVMLAEQLYRATNILAGTPYHRV